jgi:hypothetical protein
MDPVPGSEMKYKPKDRRGEKGMPNLLMKAVADV